MFIGKDISYRSTDLYRNIQANWKIHFGLCRTKSMKALLHWVQDVYHVSVYPNIFDLNEVIFIQKLDTALVRAETGKKLIHQPNTNYKEASPGPLIPGKKWNCGIKSSSTIFPHSLELIELTCLVW